MTDYFQKYIKYKKLYLEKKMIGGHMPSLITDNIELLNLESSKFEFEYNITDQVDKLIEIIKKIILDYSTLKIKENVIVIFDFESLFLCFAKIISDKLNPSINEVNKDKEYTFSSNILGSIRNKIVGSFVNENIYYYYETPLKSEEEQLYDDFIYAYDNKYIEKKYATTIIPNKFFESDNLKNKKINKSELFSNEKYANKDIYIITYNEDFIIEFFLHGYCESKNNILNNMQILLFSHNNTQLDHNLIKYKQMSKSYDINHLFILLLYTFSTIDLDGENYKSKNIKQYIIDHVDKYKKNKKCYKNINILNVKKCHNIMKNFISMLTVFLYKWNLSTDTIKCIFNDLCPYIDKLLSKLPPNTIYSSVDIFTNDEMDKILILFSNEDKFIELFDAELTKLVNHAAKLQIIKTKCNELKILPSMLMTYFINKKVYEKCKNNYDILNFINKYKQVTQIIVSIANSLKKPESELKTELELKIKQELKTNQEIEIFKDCADIKIDQTVLTIKKNVSQYKKAYSKYKKDNSNYNNQAITKYMNIMIVCTQLLFANIEQCDGPVYDFDVIDRIAQNQELPVIKFDTTCCIKKDKEKNNDIYNSKLKILYFPSNQMDNLISILTKLETSVVPLAMHRVQSKTNDNQKKKKKKNKP